jgi:hypothetical protein
MKKIDNKIQIKIKYLKFFLNKNSKLIPNTSMKNKENHNKYIHIHTYGVILSVSLGSNLASLTLSRFKNCFTILSNPRPTPP